MKDETVGVTIKDFAGSKPKMYSFFTDEVIEHKIVVATISHIE